MHEDEGQEGVVDVGTGVGGVGGGWPGGGEDAVVDDAGEGVGDRLEIGGEEARFELGEDVAEGLGLGA